MADDLTYDQRYTDYISKDGLDDEFVYADDGSLQSTKYGVFGYAKDFFVRGAVKGILNLDEAITTGRYAVGEQLGLKEKGATKEKSKEYQALKEKMKERGYYPKTMAGHIGGTLFQYGAPGIGWYNAFSKIIKIPQGVSFIRKLWPITKRALLAEAGTVATAQLAEDPNLIGGIAEIFEIDTETAGSLAKEFFNYLATTEDTTEGATADQVLSAKLKAIIADSPIAIPAEGIIPLVSTIFKGTKSFIRSLIGKPSEIDAAEKALQTVIETGDTAAFKGGKTDLGEKAEGFIPGTKEQLQESGNVKNIMEEMNAAKMDFDKLGIELQDKYNAKWQSRIKDIDRIEEKIATKNISPDKISDYLGGRLMFKNLNDLKRALAEIKKDYTIIKEENYLKGDAFIKKGKPEQGGYRAVHLQLANKKGQSMELQLRLQALEQPLKESYKGYARIRKYIDILPPERRAIEIKKQNKLKKEVDTAFLKLKKHPGRDFPFEKFIDAIERKSEITDFIARLNIKANKTATDIKELKILKSRYSEINQTTTKLAATGGAVAIAYMKAVAKNDENETRIINTQKEETNGN